MVFDPSAVARAIAIETVFKNLSGGNTFLLPQHVGVIGQGTGAGYSLDPFDFTDAREVGERFGFGSPVHLMTLMLRPSNGDGLGSIQSTIYPVAEADVSGGVAATDGDVTAVGTQVGAGTYRIIAGGIPSNFFTLAEDDGEDEFSLAGAAAVNATINMPVTATDLSAGSGEVALTAKFTGATSNDILIEFEITTGTGIALTAMQGTDGAGVPDITNALAGLGNDWVTVIVNQYPISVSTVYDALETEGSARSQALASMPFVALGGYNDATPDAGELFGEARKATDRWNGLITALGSTTLEMQIAARGAARVAVQANNNPARDYATQALDLIVPGPSSAQLDYNALDASVKQGLSTSKLVSGVMRMENTVQFYHPDGEDPPAYRWVVTSIKVMQIIFNIDLIFNSDEWAGAPLIPDDQATTNPLARKPKDAKAALNTMIDGLALAAILSAPEIAKPKTTAVISGTNPDRLDTSITVSVSGFTNIITIGNNWGFFFGTTPLAA